ncbi:MAG: hydrogen gas-evolving membrane-bound hydrogenase subunit E, partial [Candidatus Micrarchaeota archaeon]
LLLSSFGSTALDSAKLVLDTAVPAAGAANIVCAVVLDIRGYDTLGEATLLFAAVMGVVILLSEGRDEEKPREKERKMNITLPQKVEPAPLMKIPNQPILEDSKPPWVKDVLP